MGWATAGKRVRQRANAPTRRGAGLAGHLLLAQSLVVVAGTLTAWLTAANVGPSVFHQHLARADLGAATPAQVIHDGRANQSANAISLSLALLAALVAALGVSVYQTRQTQVTASRPSIPSFAGSRQR